MIAAVDRLALQLCLFLPFERAQAALQRDVIVAAVELVLAFVGRDGGDGVRHRFARHQVAAAKLDAIHAEIVRDHVEEAFAEKICLEATGPAVGADRGFVGQLQRNVDIDVLDAIGPDMNCATLRAPTAPLVRMYAPTST